MFCLLKKALETTRLRAAAWRWRAAGKELDRAVLADFPGHFEKRNDDCSDVSLGVKPPIPLPCFFKVACIGGW